MGAECLSSQTSAKMESSNSSSSPLLKLFGSDPIDALGNVHPLRNIRNKIYSYAWSRDRRDSQKLDWVVSERGFNRNVPERYFPDTPHGTAAFQHLDELPCNLHLVNKQISKDFLRFIYTVNHLEIDVDLKATSTKQGIAALNKIVNILQNTNLVNFTQNVRVRIHFPAKYPTNNLPTFNFHLLSDISWSLDRFRSLDRMTVRVVPMQGSLIDYELRVAAFPFFPMRMTNWSIRTLNDTTFPYQWDTVDEQQVHLLHKAWALYMESGSLSASVHPDPEPVHQQPACAGNVHNSMPTKRNGSQKRKDCKRNAITEEPFAGTSTSVDELEASSSATQPHPGTPPSVQSRDAESSGAQMIALKPDASGVAIADVDVDADARAFKHNLAAIGSLTEAFLGCRAVAALLPASGTSAKRLEAENTGTNGSSTSPNSLILTPPSTSDDEDNPNPDVPEADCWEHEMEQSMDSHCFSETSSSAILDMASDIHAAHDGGIEESEDGHVAAQMPDNCRKQNQATGKRKNRKKKARKSSHKLIGTQPADNSLAFTNSQSQPSKEPSEDTMKSLSSGHDDDARASSFNLANIELHAVTGLPHLVFYQDPDTKSCMVLQRDPRIDRILRSQERLRTDCNKREAEKKEARNKRQTRKAKQLLLRRGNIAANSPLSRAMQPRRESHSKKSTLERESPVEAGHLFENRIVESDDESVQTEIAARDDLGTFLGHLMDESEVNDDHNLNSIIQNNVEKWAQSYSADQDDIHKQDMCRFAECSSPSSGVHPDGEHGHSYYDLEGRSGQVQHEYSPQSPRSTDVEAHNSRNPIPSGSERMNKDFALGESGIGRCASYDDDRRQIVYPELGGLAEESVNTAKDYDGDNPFITDAQPVPCQIPFVCMGSQEEGTTAQGAQLGFDQPGLRDFSPRGGSDHLSAQDNGLGREGHPPRGPSAAFHESNETRTAAHEEENMFVPDEDYKTTVNEEEISSSPDEGQGTFVSDEEEFASDEEGPASDEEESNSDGEESISDGEESTSD